MKTVAVRYLIVMGLLTPMLASAASGNRIAHKGNGHGATACSICHGVDGQGNDAVGFPRLAGLNSSYLDTQLQNFASGRRSNAIMMPIAKALSVPDMWAVARYYAGLPVPAAALRPNTKPNPSG